MGRFVSRMGERARLHVSNPISQTGTWSNDHHLDKNNIHSGEAEAGDAGTILAFAVELFV